MQGRLLPSISGKSDIRVTEVDNDYIYLSTVTNESKTRPLSEIRKIVDQMQLNLPIHVDSVLGGSGTSRNQPETILANLPDVEWMKLQARKHLIWLGRKTHELGTISQADAFTTNVARKALLDLGATRTDIPVSLVVFSSHLSGASQLLTTIMQGASPRPLGNSEIYCVSSPQGKAILLPNPDEEFEGPLILPCISVPSTDEAARRIKVLYPDSTNRLANEIPRIIVVKLPNGTGLALAEIDKTWFFQ